MKKVVVGGDSRAQAVITSSSGLRSQWLSSAYKALLVCSAFGACQTKKFEYDDQS